MRLCRVRVKSAKVHIWGLEEVNLSDEPELLMFIEEH